MYVGLEDLETLDLETSEFRFQAPDFGVQISDFRLQISDLRPLTSSV